MDNDLKKIEGRLFNLELHLLDIKYQHILDKKMDKGRLIDTTFIYGNTSLEKRSILKAIKNERLPVYFFESEINRLLKEMNLPIIYESQK